MEDKIACEETAEEEALGSLELKTGQRISLIIF
jgi:hypothetical protein